MNIEFYDITLRGEMADAQYFITDANGTANVQQQITRQQLVNFIEEKGLNKFYCHDETMTLNAEAFLEENYRNVITLYVTENAN